MKFRAPTSGLTMIFFNMDELFEDKFSNRELLFPWLQEGGIPDVFTGRKDKLGFDIYHNDIAELTVVHSYTSVVDHEEIYEDLVYTGVIHSTPGYGTHLKCFKCYDNNTGEYKDLFPKVKGIANYRTTVIGNIHHNKNIIK